MPLVNRRLSKTLTFVMAGGHGTRLHPLTKERAKPAVIFGGIYRLIDFTLTNCYHSGIMKIVILTQYRSRSLHRHIFNGWSFFNTRPDEFIDINPPQFRERESWYLGTADAIYQNMFTINAENPEYILILAGDHIYKMDYSKFLRYHVEKEADLSISCIEVPREKASQFGILKVNKNYEVLGFYEKPDDPPTIPGNPKKCLVSMGIYFFNTRSLKRVLEDDSRTSSKHDFGKDIIPMIMQEKLNVLAYPFVDENRKPEPYWRDVGDIDAYFEANMDLVAVEPLFNLYDPYWPVLTWYPPLPPAKTVFADEDKVPPRVGKALDSILSPGSIISGGYVNRSIISPRVKVNSYSDVRESIIMDNVDIGRGARIKRTIIDKDIKIPPKYIIGYDLEADRKRFHVTEGGIVVIEKGHVLE